MTKTVTLNVAPDKGAAALVSGMTLPGYRFVKMTRKGTQVKVLYERVKKGN